MVNETPKVQPQQSATAQPVQPVVKPTAQSVSSAISKPFGAD